MQAWVHGGAQRLLFLRNPARGRGGRVLARAVPRHERHGLGGGDAVRNRRTRLQQSKDLMSRKSSVRRERITRATDSFFLFSYLGNRVSLPINESIYI
jgi:hypothetical protein